MIKTNQNRTFGVLYKIIIVILFFACFPLLASDAPDKATAQKWLDAVRNNNQKQAVAMADKLVKSSEYQYTANKLYILLFQKAKLAPQLLTSPFNKYDFQLWRDACFFQQLAQRLTKGCNDPLKKLTEAVSKRLKSYEKPDTHPLWPYHLWQRGFGVCDRQSMVLCELAYQLGYKTAIVWLWDSAKNVSPHTICIIKSPEGKIWIGDPLHNNIIPVKSFISFSKDAPLITKLWSKNWQSYLQNSRIFIPAYPQDYCIKNKILYERIHKLLKDKCPKFGKDPISRFNDFFRTGENYQDILNNKRLKKSFFGQYLIELHKQIKLNKETAKHL